MQLREIISLEITKFIFIGAINTLIGIVVFSVLYFILNNGIISLFLAYIFGIVFNYKTYSKYVFINSNKQVFINFCIIYVAIFVFNSFLLYFIENVIGVNIYLSQLIAIIIVTPILYISNKKYVFIENKD